MKLFVLALLALSCVQLVIAKYKKTPFQTNEQVIQTPQESEDLPTLIVEPTNFGSREHDNPLSYLHITLPPSITASDSPVWIGKLRFVPNHPELFVFIPDHIDQTPGSIGVLNFVYFRRAIPKVNKMLDPVGQVGRLAKVRGRDMLSFIPLDLIPPNGGYLEPRLKTGYRGSGFKRNQPGLEFDQRPLYLKAVVPPLFGLEEYGIGREGVFKALPSGVYDFKPLRLDYELQYKDPKLYWVNATIRYRDNPGDEGIVRLRDVDDPSFYLKTELQEKFKYDGRTWRGRLYQWHPGYFKFETAFEVIILDDQSGSQIPTRNRPGKIRRTHSDGNEAMMRGLPNTYWNPASRFL